MSMTIGRIGLGTTSGGDGLTLRGPDGEVGSVTQKGEAVTIDGLLADPARSASLTAADARILRGQLLGLVGNADEAVIPFTCTENPHLDGFYTVTSVDVDDPDHPDVLYFPFTVDMARVPGWQAPLFEIQCRGNLRSNTQGITTANTLAGVGFPVLPAGAVVAPSNLTSASRTGTDGAVTRRYDSSETLFNLAPTYTGSAAYHYKGSARIEYDSTGSGAWRSVVGRQVVNSPSAIRLSNSLVRVWIDSSANLNVAHYDGSAWDTALVYNFWDGTALGTGFSLIGAVTVLRNSPEVCSIRIGLSTSNVATTTAAQPYVDLTLSRAARGVDCYLYGGGSAAWGVYRAASEAATAISGGLRATSDDASGNRFVLATPSTKTNTLSGNSGFALSSAGTALPFYVASEVGGSGAASADQAQNLVYAYMAAVSNRQRVVAR